METPSGVAVDQYTDHLLDPEEYDLSALAEESLLEQLEQDFSQELGNPDLPIYARRQEIMDSLVQNQVTILVAETGAGKSTQAPLLALQAGFKDITITQPRRRAALNVGQRVRQELGQAIGLSYAEELVSIQTGAGREGPRQARVKVVTDGLHLIRDGDDMINKPAELWIIDEVHEANVNIELLMALGREKAQLNPNFRMLIMSATMEKERLADYFTVDDGKRPPIIEVEGRTYPVEQREEAESNVVSEVLKAVQDIHDNPDNYDGAKTIQVFVPGKREIKDTIDKLANTLPAHLLKQTYMFGLHSKIPEAMQQPAYEPVPGIKIIVQTKIGQTSMTVPGTRYVISSGLERMIELDDADTEGLMLRPSSQDDLTQQAGRTGRTNEGIYILTKLDDKSSFISKEQRDLRPAPEIQRSQLDSSEMFLEATGRDIAQFNTLNEISPTSIERAKYRLAVLGALDADGTITSKGRRMNQYPCSPSSAASMVHVETAPLLVRNYMAAIAAIKEAGGLKQFGPDSQRRWEDLTEDMTSDDLSELELFIAAQDMDMETMLGYDIEYNNLVRAREQYRKLAKRAGADPNIELLLPKPEEREQLREAILAGSLNNIYLPVGDGLYRLLGDLAVPREISNHSALTGSHMPLVGTPRNIAIMRNGKPEIKKIIENVTEVSVHAIGRVATHMVVWQPARYVERGGTWMMEERKAIGDYIIGTQEVPAEPNPLLRNTIIEKVMTSPPKHLRYLYSIKSTLEELAHKTTEPIKRLTEDDIRTLIQQAAPEDITDTTIIDHNLRLLIEELDLSVDAFVSPARQQHIDRRAPAFVGMRGARFGLYYSKGTPIAKSWSLDSIAEAPDDLQLPDYRQVKFYYRYGDVCDKNDVTRVRRGGTHDAHRKLYTLPQLKKALRDDGLL